MRVLRTAEPSPTGATHDTQPGCVPQGISALAPLCCGHQTCPDGIRGDAVVRAQMRAQGLLQLTPCVLWVKLFSLPELHCPAMRAGPQVCPVGHLYSLRAAQEGVVSAISSHTQEMPRDQILQTQLPLVRSGRGVSVAVLPSGPQPPLQRQERLHGQARSQPRHSPDFPSKENLHR